MIELSSDSIGCQLAAEWAQGREKSTELIGPSESHRGDSDIFQMIPLKEVKVTDGFLLLKFRSVL